MDVQVFGTNSCADTRKALRFFKERRITVHFVDLKQRAASKGELRRFVQKFGADAVLDRDSKRLKSLGLERMLYGDDKWLDIMSEEPRILRTPLVRSGSNLTIGHEPEVWEGWV